MRSLLLSALAATTVLATTAIGLSTDANAAARRPHHRTHIVPYVRQDPSGSFNALGTPGFAVDPAPVYRWPPSGGAT